MASSPILMAKIGWFKAISHDEEYERFTRQQSKSESTLMFRQDNVRHDEELLADDITVLGSGSIVQQLANLGLIDEYQLVVVPLVLGSGKRLFEDVKLDLHLEDSPAFANGVVVVTYTSQEVSSQNVAITRPFVFNLH